MSGVGNNSSPGGWIAWWILADQASTFFVETHFVPALTDRQTDPRWEICNKIEHYVKRSNAMTPKQSDIKIVPKLVRFWYLCKTSVFTFNVLSLNCSMRMPTPTPPPLNPLNALTTAADVAKSTSLCRSCSPATRLQQRVAAAAAAAKAVRDGSCRLQRGVEALPACDWLTNWLTDCLCVCVAHAHAHGGRREPAPQPRSWSPPPPPPPPSLLQSGSPRAGTQQQQQQQRKQHRHLALHWGSAGTHAAPHMPRLPGRHLRVCVSLLNCSVFWCVLQSV